jgi:dienelactone hydrolase
MNRKSMRRSLPLSLFLFSALIAMAATTQSEPDALPRRGYFGVSLEKAEGGVRVFAVTPDSTASAAGIEIGDIIQAIDGTDAVSPEAVVAAIGKHKSSESIRIEIAGHAGRQTIMATLKPYPTERMPNATVQYSSVAPLAGGRLRTILSVPSEAKGGRFPAVLLIQGGGCGSIDTPFSIDIGQPALMHAIGTKGFVTMRVEKSGVGDSEGQPCPSIGYNEELAGYRAALSSLRTHPSVDPQQIYLLGVSLGGVFAPILAAETKVAGISVYGTGAAPPPTYEGRSDRFFREFASIDVLGAWAKVAGRVQILHGEYDDDPYVNAASHERIAKAVTDSGNSRVQYRELAGLDHCWTRHASLQASKDKCGQGERTTVVEDAIIAFLMARE